ncbi:hypothetical protein MUK42_35437 [Musa troglodytarum]|uniref:Uncharacterized protein n=1 Tax=Musa troglodytarum TaxID=320322 RepID=A0A9E7G457_9LILI|nr:hypothetical protein MUK42_35437 [Musa troglodytarum]
MEPGNHEGSPMIERWGGVGWRGERNRSCHFSSPFLSYICRLYALACARLLPREALDPTLLFLPPPPRVGFAETKVFACSKLSLSLRMRMSCVCGDFGEKRRLWSGCERKEGSDGNPREQSLKKMPVFTGFAMQQLSNRRKGTILSAKKMELYLVF